MSDWPGMPVVVSPLLPIEPTPGEWAKRYVRHSMADVLRWLGEEVGPSPSEVTDALQVGGTLIVSQRCYESIQRLA